MIYDMYLHKYILIAQHENDYKLSYYLYIDNTSDNDDNGNNDNSLWHV